MGATNTKQMKFASHPRPEGEGQNMNSKSQQCQGLQQGHKSQQCQGLEQGQKRWDIGQSQNLHCHGRRDSRENVWRKSKDGRHSDEGEEQECFETGFQPKIKRGVWVDCGLQDFGWSREEHTILPVQVDQELPMQVSRKLPMQVDQDLPIQVRKKLPMQVEI